MPRVYTSPAAQISNAPGVRPQTKSERQRTTQKLRYLSHYDALTNLPNRASVRSRLRKALKHAECLSARLAVVFLSLDPYQRINETLGPAMGDRLVRCVAKRLKETIGANHVVGYWGSGEFVLLLEYSGEESDVLEIAQAIKKRIERRFFSFGQEFFLTSSIGIAVCPSQATAVEALLRNAAAAHRQAKECGGNGCRFYTVDMNVRSLERFTLENSLGRGLRRREFSLHYQPEVDAVSRQITGAEALIRWDHPKLGQVQPGDFIPLAEKNGTIVPIGEWVLRAACRQLKKWHVDGFKKLNLAINVSARQFQERAPADVIVKILAENRLDPTRVELELTESLLIADSDHVVQSLGKLKDIGVKLALDDFGTGFSSLEYLCRLPLDILKIDRSFVRAASSRDGAALLSSIINLAHKLGLRVVAEGVETREQSTLLQGLGCDSLQGFLFSPPLPGEQFKRLLLYPNCRFEEVEEFAHPSASSRPKRAIA
ncbi:MAG: bifunctional diguanylate cyclase/phosphodiesterase [Pyrinomonadaceae bacterium]|nr:bifunctional diguanylate cyclase/phosphodiesterase [Pyrinomonadaceae bacterium]